MQSAEVRRGVGLMETGHSSYHDRGEDRVQGDDAEGKSGGVTLGTGDVVIGRGDPPPSSGSGVLAAPELHSDLHAVVERVVDVLHAVGLWVFVRFTPHLSPDPPPPHFLTCHKKHYLIT